MPIISGLLNQTIDTVYSVAKNTYGDVTRTSVYTDIECRWQEQITKLIGINNEEIMSKVEVWLLPKYIDIVKDWEIVNNSETYKIIVTKKVYDLSGNIDHYKLFLR